MKIDLSEKITNNFTWSEVLYLREWKLHAFPIGPDVYLNLIRTMEKMQLIRDYLKKPITITSCYRPLEYNSLIGGAKKSKHIDGLACDFQVKGLTADQARTKILMKIEQFDIRMENKKDANWVHIDLYTMPGMSIQKRFFTP